MARVFRLLVSLKSLIPFWFSLAISLLFSIINIYILAMKVVREKIIECTIRIKEGFSSTEDALTENKEGKIISVDIVNSKFIRNNIKLIDGETKNVTSKTQG